MLPRDRISTLVGGGANLAQMSPPIRLAPWQSANPIGEKLCLGAVGAEQIEGFHPQAP